MTNSSQALNIVSILKDNGYKIKEDGTSITLKKPNSGSLSSFIVFGVIGLVLLGFGTYIGLHFATILCGFFFLGVPLIYDRYRYPNQIIIDSARKLITLKSGFTVTKTYPFDDISSLEVDEAIVTSDVSPFKDGYQDFIYTFKLHIGQGKKKLLNLVFRQKSESHISLVMNYLSEQLAIRKSV